MAAFFAIPINDWPKNQDGTSAVNIRYVSKFICTYHPQLQRVFIDCNKVPLSVAMILPFLILAFTINGMRDKVENWSRRLDLQLMDAGSIWKRAIIRVLWVTYPVSYPVSWVVNRCLRFFYKTVWYFVYRARRSRKNQTSVL
jgi:hypothetical protein